MKYAVTGHSSGIAKELYTVLSPDCMGFSRSNGYDITSNQDRKRIVNEAYDCDVFINSANAGMGQTQLLIDLFYAWQNLDKKIIVVGSRIADYKEAIYKPKLLQYQAEKLILKEMTLKLQNISSCVIEYKSFGYVGTERILQKYPNFKYPNDYISVSEAVNIILSGT